MSRFDPEAREREAQAEMAATAIPRLAALSLLAVFLLVVAAGPLLELGAVAGGSSQVWTALPTPAARSVLERLRAAIDEVEHRYDERSALVRAIRPPAQAELYRRLGYGNERAYAGRGAWLFFRPAFDHLTASTVGPEFEGDPAAAVIDFRDRLAERGVALVVLPVPVKLALHPERFVASPPPVPVRPAAERSLFAALESAGIALADPTRDLLLRARRSGAAFLERDTHWTPAAVDDVARDLAIELRGVATLPPGVPGSYQEEVVELRGRGDLAALLGLAGDSASDERTPAGRVVTADGSPWRATRGAPVLLLGDSFSAVFSLAELGWGSGAGLAERLSFHLGLPVDRIVRNAGGASATREALAAELVRDPARLDGVRVVVWQFAAREITQGSWTRPVW